MVLTKNERRKLTRHEVWHYTIGVCNVLFMVFIIARVPWNYFIMHFIMSIVLLLWRFVRFRKRNWELYLTDFCYFTTYFSWLCTILAFLRIYGGYESQLTPYRNFLVRGFFTLVNGPLAWSILIFGNNLVFHDIDQTTSVFIHLSPALLTWCIRWGGGYGPSVIWTHWKGLYEICPDSLLDTEVGRIEADSCISKLWCGNVCDASISEFMIPGLIVWMVWAVSYYVIVIVLLRNWRIKKSKETLFDFVMSRKNMTTTFIKYFPKHIQPLVYMFTHLMTTVIFGVISTVFWHSFIIHTFFLMCITGLSIRNGASYVFRKVMKDYESKLLKRKYAKPKPTSIGYAGTRRSLEELLCEVEKRILPLSFEPVVLTCSPDPISMEDTHQDIQIPPYKDIQIPPYKDIQIPRYQNDTRQENIHDKNK